MLPLFDCPSCIRHVSKFNSIISTDHPLSDLAHPWLDRFHGQKKKQVPTKCQLTTMWGCVMITSFLRYFSAKRAYSESMGHECLNSCMWSSLDSVRVSLSTISQWLGMAYISNCGHKNVRRESMITREHFSSKQRITNCYYSYYVLYI